MSSAQDVRLSRPHIKFLAVNYLTYQIKSEQSGGSPLCRICPTECTETVSHVISTCTGMAAERGRLLIEYSQLCKKAMNHIEFDEMLKNEDTLCQFILDPLSLNLQTRVSLSDPLVPEFYKEMRGSRILKPVYSVKCHYWVQKFCFCQLWSCKKIWRLWWSRL